MREFLKGLELDNEKIDKIMAEHGKMMTKQIDDYNELNTKYTSLKDEYDTLSKKGNSSEDLKNQLDEMTNKYNKLNNDYINLNNINTVTEAGVNKKFAKFVANEVQSKVDDKTDFNTAFENYIKENPQFKEQDNSIKVMKVNSSIDMTNQEEAKKGVNSMMNDLILKATGRK